MPATVLGNAEDVTPGESTTSDLPARRREPTARAGRLGRGLLAVLVWVLVWGLVAVPVALWSLTHDSAASSVAGHDVRVTPTLESTVHLRMGPYLPDLRLPRDGALGLEVVAGKTSAGSAPELVERYAAIAGSPDGEIRRLQGVVADQVRTAVGRGALAGLLVPGVWWLVGSRRRAELRVGASRPWRTWRGRAATLVVVVLVVTLVPWPWRAESPPPTQSEWLPLAEAFPAVDIPAELAQWQVQGGIVTAGTQQLLGSALETYDRSTVFYDEVREEVEAVADELRTPEEDESVALLISDRHDNVGMDVVARQVAEEAGATIVLNAGDDTSTGEPWEAFSLDSLDLALDDLEHRVSVLGNHDSGDFVGPYLADRGWERLQDGPVEIEGVRIDGVDDPRSSGLGPQRRSTGRSFGEVEAEVADDACTRHDAGERVAVLLVHDANLGRTALARGCADLVVGGHLHTQVGPDLVEGSNGELGWTYTNGTTGGAAFAIALGSKIRRDAQVTLITFADGRPTGLQPVTVRTTGEVVVSEWIALDREATPELGPGQVPSPEPTAPEEQQPAVP